jgi:hypothetical protein
MNYAETCHHCRQFSRTDFTCRRDGKPIAQHVREAQCPLGKYDNATPPMGLGTLAGAAIAAITGATPCGGCKKVQKTLDRIFPLE